MQPTLGDKVTVVMDRPLGSKHPEHNFIYSVNYGYIPDTVAGDGEEMDAYVLGEYEPLTTFEGYIIAVIERKDDVENKFVVAKEKGQFTKEEIKVLVDFQERFFDSTIIMEENLLGNDELPADSLKVVSAVGNVLFSIIFLISIIRKEHPYNLAVVYSSTCAVKSYYLYKDKKSKGRKAELISMIIIAISCIIMYIAELCGA